MNYKYSQRLTRILGYSKEEALRLNNDYIGPEHLMLGLIRDGESKALDVLRQKFFVNIPNVKQLIEDKLRDEGAKLLSTDIALTMKANTVMRLAVLEARLMKSEESDAEHMLLAILKQHDNLVAKVLEDNEVTYKELFDSFTTQTATQQPQSQVGYEDDEDEDTEDAPPPSGSSNARENSSSTKTAKKGNTDTPAIDKFGFDLTKAAAEGKLDPVVGRQNEIERLAQILSRRKKNNPVLIGEPGVGKSAIVEGLAIRITQRKVARVLFGKRIVSLDMSSVVAGTKYRGQFEERMRSIINELRANPDIIVFIDEIHTLVGAGNQAGQMDAANMMKPALARGELQCIGATTLDEYRKSIEKDGALERRFQKVIVEQTTPEETLTILNNIKERYEDHHNVSYTDEALAACVKLTERYVTDRSFPDKAIDVLDEVGSRVRINNINVPKEIEEKEAAVAELIAKKDGAVKNQNYELAAQYRDRSKLLAEELDEMRAKWEASLEENRKQVTADEVAQTVSMMTGIPVSKMASAEGIRMKGMKQELKSSVIAQDSAIDKLVSAIQRSRVGLKDPNRPIGTFMFLGPTGVGKTYLAKKLADYMFGSTDALIRIDMSEYMEKFTVSRLVGAPPGYVGYEEGGMLTEKVRRKPYSIVLLDEIEKAHPDVFNLLLQVMDDGRLTDSNGRTVDFRNTVIIMTSNVGTRQLKEFGRGVGFSAMTGMDDKEVSRSVIQKALNKQFSPEFLNRIDEIITFDQLELEAILQIIGLELKGLYKRMEELGFNLEISEDAQKFIAEKGYDKQFGARPLRRAIQQHLEDKISEMIVEEDLNAGDTIVAELVNDKIEIKKK
ncbi:MAG: ATP-dependent Clp protease ATP-binding subunit [Prevotellaceae bacterium]|nr:ATP-dependent Clp protease ATP-binding subunit [Candidatus Minthosoma caballi]